LGVKDSLDLFLAVRRCNYTIQIIEEKRTTGVWIWEREQTRYSITITVSDRYDFTSQPWDSVGNYLNNAAWILHDYFDVGKDYQWDATFTYTTKWEG